MKRVKKAAPLDKDPYPLVIETFRDLGAYELSGLRQAEPSCFNSHVRVRKFRVTIEPIEEPVEVIRERLQKLWDECDNHHHWQPLRAAAKKVGLTLEHEGFGKRRPTREVW